MGVLFRIVGLWWATDEARRRPQSSAGCEVGHCVVDEMRPHRRHRVGRLIRPIQRAAGPTLTNIRRTHDGTMNSRPLDVFPSDADLLQRPRIIYKYIHVYIYI